MIKRLLFLLLLCTPAFGAEVPMRMEEEPYEDGGVMYTLHFGTDGLSHRFRTLQDIEDFANCKYCCPVNTEPCEDKSDPEYTKMNRRIIKSQLALKSVGELVEELKTPTGKTFSLTESIVVEELP